MSETLTQKVTRWILEGVPIGEVIRRRNDLMRKGYAQTMAQIKKDHEERLKRMFPPETCFRIGRQIFWTRPNTDLRVNFFEISEQMSDGRWTVHGTKTPANKHEAILYGDGPCRVEACYPQTGLYETPGLGPVLEADPQDFIFLVGRIRFFASSGNQDQNNLWRRALAGLGVIDAGVGWAGRPPVSPLEPAMTAAEAQGLADSTGDRWWAQTARVMARLQGIELIKPEKKPEVMTDTVDITLSLVAAQSHRNTGAYGQHRTPPGAGSLTPSSFTIEGKSYQVRGWYTHKIHSDRFNFQLNLNSGAEEEAFKAAGVNIHLGQGDVINSLKMSRYGGTLNHEIAALYRDGQSYEIRITK